MRMQYLDSVEVASKLSTATQSAEMVHPISSRQMHIDGRARLGNFLGSI